MLETENMLTEKVLSHEDRLASLEAQISAMTISAGGSVPDNVLVQDEKGGLKLAGIFEAKEVVAGAYKVKNEDPAHRTMGDEKISADESEKKVETSAISDTAKVFLSFESDPGSRFWTEKIKDEITGEYAGFIIKFSEPAEAEIKANWWIVDSR